MNAEAPDASVETPADPGRIVLLTASHRVAPGLLSWPAWQTLHAADRVLVTDPDHPQLPYLREAGYASSTPRPPPTNWSPTARAAGRSSSWSAARATAA